MHKMSDNRFTYQHMTDLALKALLSEHGQDDDDFKALVEDIPEPGETVHVLNIAGRWD